MEGNNIKVVEARKIYEQLALIQERPWLLLTSKSITALQNYLNGYTMWIIGDKDAYHPGEPMFDDFKYWLLNKTNTQTHLGNPYSRVLLRECEGDEEKAFDRFFEYLEVYKKEMMEDKLQD